VPAFRVFTKNDKSADRIVNRLLIVRTALQSLWQTGLTEPLNVVLCDDEASFLEWAGVQANATDRNTKTIRTPAGLVLVVNGAPESVDRAVGRAYVLAAFERTALPRWLAEGLAQVVNTANIQGDELTVGAVTINAVAALDTMALRELQQLAWAVPPTQRFEEASINPRSKVAERLMRPSGGGLYSAAETSGADTIPIVLNGHDATWMEVADYCDQELKRREETRGIAQPEDEFFTFFRSNQVPPLEVLFDPNAGDQPAWRMAAWALTHYCLFGGDKELQPALMKFVGALHEQPQRKPIDLFVETFNVKPSKFAVWLAAYAENGRYKVPTYRLGQKFEPAKIEYQPLSESPVLQLKAATLFATGRTDDARMLLNRGYLNPENRTPAYLRALVDLELDHDRERATKILETAASKQQLDARGQRLLGRARLEKLQTERAGAPFGPEDMKAVLQPLFAALNGGDQSEELFLLIGRAWSLSSIAPKNEHLNALRMGLKYHPKSEGIAQLLAKLGG